MWTVIVSGNRPRIARQVDDWRSERAGRSRHIVVTEQCAALVEPSDDGVVIDTEDELLVGRATLDQHHHGESHGPAAAQALVAAARRPGPRGFDELVGDFAFVIWRSFDAELRAVRDHVGVGPLYYAQRDDALYLSDSQAALAGNARLDEEYVAGFIAGRGVCPHRGVWSGVVAVPPASVLTWTAGRLRIESFWQPQIPAVSADPGDIETAARQFRALLKQSLRSVVEPEGRTWSHLSGGLDSSSVAATAAHSARHGHGHALGGTITFIDRDRSGDETAFSDTVVAQYGLTNVLVDEEWPWRDDGEPPPAFDEPARDLPFYARDRRVANVLRSHGATTLLSGVGPDHLLPATPAHIPDLFWQGELRGASSELYRWAACRGESVWRGFAKHAVYPIAMRRLHPWWRQATSEVSEWFTQRFLKNQELGRRISDAHAVPGGMRGALYEAATREALQRVGAGCSTWCSSRGIRVRHPYLYQPLVKFCVGLSYRLRTDIYQQKPVLRAAMRSILPEPIRQRRSKGGQLEPRICRAFAKERPYLTRLLKRSVLADYGVIEPARALAAIDRAAAGMLGGVGYLYAMLSLEMWLSMRSGR
jgi:asparagine synthase (glutamine-hydrolysing)